MKKIIVTFLAATFITSSIGTIDTNASTQIKLQKFNYANKATVQAIKKGKITKMNGLQLGKPFYGYQNNMKYNINESRHQIKIDNEPNSDYVIADFSDKYNNPTISRIVDIVNFEKYNNRLSVKNIKKLYGKPKYSKIRYYSKSVKQPMEYIAIYPNVTFYFGYYNKQSHLNYVVHHGNAIKKNLSKWKYFNMVENKTYFMESINRDIEYYAWLAY